MKRYAVATVLLAVALIFLWSFFGSRGPSFDEELAGIDTAKTTGDPNAPIRVIEFMDFQCGECAKAHGYIKEFIRSQPQRYYLAVQQFPLDFLNSHLAAKYAHCAAQQNRFWLMHDLMIANQNVWRTSYEAGGYFMFLARREGLDTDALSRCVEHPFTKEAVEKEKDFGRRWHVLATPAYFVNGRRAVGLEQLQSLLADLEASSDETQK